MDEIKEVKEPKKKTVKITLPKTRETKEPQWVGVNGKKYTINHGVQVEVPLAVAEVLENKEKMLDKLYELEDAGMKKMSV